MYRSDVVNSTVSFVTILAKLLYATTHRVLVYTTALDREINSIYHLCSRINLV